MKRREIIPGPKKEIARIVNWRRWGGIIDPCNVGFSIIRNKKKGTEALMKKNCKWRKAKLSMLYRRLNLEISIVIMHLEDVTKRRSKQLNCGKKKVPKRSSVIY